MKSRDLNALFQPESVAVIGADAGSAGERYLRNLLTGGFPGPIMPVSPRQKACAGVLAYPEVANLPVSPELAVIGQWDQAVPDLIQALAGAGTRVAVFAAGAVPDGLATPHHELREAAKRHGLRLLGPDSLGVLVPAHKLNASAAAVPALPGRLAFVTQSAALASAVLDWAHPRGIGFSHVVALGQAADIGFADMLDYLAGDFGTSAILLCIESLAERGDFVAAARVAARNKPVVAVRIGHTPRARGRDPEPATYASALVHPDDVFEAMLRRAGILQVDELEELFAAVKTLNRGLQTGDGRLAIVANGAGTAAMAADCLHAADLAPAALSEDTVQRLEPLLHPDTLNPDRAVINLGSTGEASRYGRITKALLQAVEVDTTLVIHAPSAFEDSEQIAQELIEAAGRSGKRRLLACWLGGATVGRARDLLTDAGIAAYESPGAAIRAFAHLVNHRRNRAMLMQTPPQLPEDARPEVETARRLIQAAKPRGALSEPDTMQVLSAYGIPTVAWHLASSPEAAAALSRKLGYPIALTLCSSDVARIRDIGGIALYLDNDGAVRAAAERMQDRASRERPHARVEGFVLRRMQPRPHARQLFLGVAVDRLFGPVIVIGEGGRAVEAYREHAVGLPPLNPPLARDLLGRTRAWHSLQGSPARPDADIDAICLAMVKLSQLVVDFPEIAEVDINPLFADDQGVTVASAHMRLTDPDSRPTLAIRPYPGSLEQTARLRDGRWVLLRPIRPEDEPLLERFFAQLTPEDLFTRFFREVKTLERSELARMTQVDYEREMAFIAQDGHDGDAAILGEVRTVTDADNTRAEFAVTVRSDMQGTGLGRLLMEKAIAYARNQGTRFLTGQVLTRNRGMLRLAQKLGMSQHPDEDPETVTVEMPLSD
ncbi:MAG: bifunctional acetate--CoA ligase family protein/GNAT family N-acetyltransferase [Ectothiorhodospiraceae bacterium]|nr:bifunctional acetate--CoA ligase family protein/GNAT family N-acetyltransferase [Ectothiorhodospiraceae bacterium]